MNNQLTLFIFMLGTVSGFSIATLIYLFKNLKLKQQGQKLIDKMVAKKQVDFFYNESIRIFLMAAEAQQFGDSELLDKLARQHGLAVRRFEEARMNLLRLETQTPQGQLNEQTGESYERDNQSRPASWRNDPYPKT